MSNYGVVQWSGTASNNSSADVNVYLAEGIAPSAVNDQFRSIMQSVAKFRDDNNGTLVTGGSTTAAAIATNQTFAALTNGLTVTIAIAGTLDSSATLNVDTLGAVNIQRYSGTNMGYGDLQGGSLYGLTYNSTQNAWIIQGYNVPQLSGLMQSTVADQAFTGGAVITSKAITSSTALSIDLGAAAFQYVTSTGNTVLSAPSADGWGTLLVTNGVNPGTFATSGFTQGSFYGDSATSTSSGARFLYNILRINGTATYTIKALQ